MLAVSYFSARSEIRVHTDHIYIKDKQAYIDVFFQADSAASITLHIECTKKAVNVFEEQRVLRVKPFSINLEKGQNKIQINLSDKRAATADESFLEVIRKYEAIPVGEYEFKVQIVDGNRNREHNVLRKVDTLLKAESALALQLKEDMERTSKSKGNNLINKELSGNRLDKLLARQGLKGYREVHGQHEFIYLFSGNWLLGSYVIGEVKTKGRRSKVKEKISDQKESLVQSSLETYESVFSQFKKDKSKESREAVGQIGATANMGTRQDAFSEQQKNFYEIYGNIELPVFDIPVSIDGYYTTQDKNRKIKSSFIHFHYDADKAKEKLMKLITGYKGEYEQVAAKGKGMDGAYKGFMQSLKGQKETIFLQLIAQTGLKDYTSFVDQEALKNGEYKIDSARLLQTLVSKAESVSQNNGDAAKIQHTRDSLRQVYTKVMKKYDQLMTLQRKYEKYSTLLEQYKNTSYFDSLLAYDKIKDLKEYENMSYKDMAKSASSLLPEGKVKKWTTGLTNIDLGMFSKYSSKYTLGGQQLKGIDVGYDIGFATTQVTAGKTEYIGRSGEIDRYTFYSGGLKFKPVLKQQIELIYYGYSPSRRMFREDSEFFKNINASVPTFKSPVHIYSLRQTGQISKYINTETEIALSTKKAAGADHTKPSLHDRLAYSLSLDGDIPKTPISLRASYEHCGKDFENNTLPFSFSGTDRISLGSRVFLFRSYLQVGVEYNHLLQRNIANTFTNVRWGFDISTKSKRYPNISLSYKPFSTYRSYADTLGIPQRPMFGQVWTARASYQVRKDGNVYRFSLMYNQAGNKVDTTQTKNELFQAGIYLTGKKSMSYLTVSKVNLSSRGQTYIPAWHLQNNYMAALGQSYNLRKNLQASAGLDMGVSRFGLSALGGTAGIGYKSKKTSMTYRLNARYTQYKLQETNDWQNVIRGTLDIVWQFRYKLNDLGKTK